MDYTRKVIAYLFPESAQARTPNLRDSHAPTTFNALDKKATDLFHADDFIHSHTEPHYLRAAWKHLFVNTAGRYGGELGVRHSDKTEPYLRLFGENNNFKLDLTTYPVYPTTPQTIIKYDIFFSDSAIRGQFTNLLNSSLDYIGYEVAPTGRVTSTAKIDVTGTVTLASVVRHRGLALGMEVAVPTEFTLSEAEAKSSAPSVNFGLSYEKVDIDYPFAFALKTREAKSWSFSSLLDVTPQIAVGAKFESNVHKTDLLSGWGVAALWKASPVWTIRAQVLPGKTAAVAVRTTTVKNLDLQASAGFHLDGSAETHLGLSAVIGTASSSPF